jgi:hypothetical protein
LSVTLLDKWQMVQAAAKDPDLSKAAVILLLRLLDHFNTSDEGREHRCFPSMQTLAADLGCSTRYVSDLIKELAQNRWIDVETRFDPKTNRQTSNSYSFISDRLSSDPMNHSSGGSRSPPEPQFILPHELQCIPPLNHSSYKQGNTNPGRNNTPSGAECEGKGLVEEEARLPLDGEPLPPSLPKAANDSSSKASRKKAPTDIDGLWAEFRRIFFRAGSNYTEARKLYERAVKAGHEPQRINAGAKDYMAFVTAEKREARHIKTAESFLATAKTHWLVDYATGSITSGGTASTGPTPEQWRLLVANFQSKGVWAHALGPEPGMAGCRAPRDLVSNSMNRAG